MEESYKYLITQLITIVLLLWSEYLGISKKHKSNAITDLIICALTPKAEEEQPTIAASPQPPSL